MKTNRVLTACVAALLWVCLSAGCSNNAKPGTSVVKTQAPVPAGMPTEAERQMLQARSEHSPAAERAAAMRPNKP